MKFQFQRKLSASHSKPYSPPCLTKRLDPGGQLATLCTHHNILPCPQPLHPLIEPTYCIATRQWWLRHQQVRRPAAQRQAANCGRSTHNAASALLRPRVASLLLLVSTILKPWLHGCWSAFVARSAATQAVHCGSVNCGSVNADLAIAACAGSSSDGSSSSSSCALT